MGRRVLNIDARVTGKAGPEIRALAALVTKSLEENRRATVRVAKAQESANERASKWFNLNEIGVGIMRRIGESITDLASSALASVGEAFAAATRSAIDFQEAIAEVATLAPEGGVDEIARAARRMAGAYGSTEVEQAKAFYTGVSAGASDSASAIALMDAANRLAVGGVTDIQSAISGLTAVVNGYGIEFSDSAAVSELFFRTMQKGVTTVGELASQDGLVIPFASSAGVGLDEMFAALGAITKSGIKTENAVTFLKNAIASIQDPSSDAAAEAKRLGIEFDVAALRSKGLQGVLQSITGSSRYTDQSLNRLFGNIRARSAVLALVANEGKTFAEVLEYMRSNADASTEAFEKMSSTLAFKIRQFDSLRTSIGSAFGDLIANSDEAAGMIDGVNESLAIFLENLTGAAEGAVVSRVEMQRLGRDGVAVLLDGFGDVMRVVGEVVLAFEGATSSIRDTYDTIKSVYDVIKWASPVTWLARFNEAIYDMTDGISYVSPEAKKLSDKLMALGDAAKTSAKQIRSGADANADYAAKTDDASKSTGDLVARLREKISELQRARAAARDHAKAEREAARARLAEERRLANAERERVRAKEHYARMAHRQTVAADRANANRERALDRLEKDRLRATESVERDKRRLAAQTARYMSSTFAGAINGMLFEAQSFEDAIGEMLKRLAAQLIESAIFQVFAALMGAPGAGGAMQGVFHGMIGAAPAFAGGGIVTGGIAGVDSVIAALTPGELVIPTKESTEIINVISGQQQQQRSPTATTVVVNAPMRLDAPPSSAQVQRHMRDNVLKAISRGVRANRAPVGNQIGRRA